ncbi:MAG: hypothetical protein V1794_03630 [Candidatus Glassbacteria bacterium]
MLPEKFPTFIAICLLAALSGCSMPVRKVADPANAGALVVTGKDTGRLLAPGAIFYNHSAEIQYVCDCAGRMKAVLPDSQYRPPGVSEKSIPGFAGIAGSLGDYGLRKKRLEKLLARMSGRGEEVADTVEFFLVYPVGARLVEAPEAFRWQGTAEVAFSIYPVSGGEPVVQTTVADSLFERGRFEKLLEKGRWYGWQVRLGDSTQASCFSLLPEEELAGLSDRLAALAEAEKQDPSAGENAFGWLALKAGWLAGNFLYYEAQAALLEAETRGGMYVGRQRELLVEVRRLQRYGHRISIN